MIYLDNGATTLRKPPEVAQAVMTAMRTCASPGRGGHRAAMAASEAVYHCRELAAELFDAEPEQVAFTMNATHGLNIAIKTLVSPGDPVVVSGFEHNAVMRPLYALGAKVSVAGQRLFDPVDTVAAFEGTITKETKAVICTHVSNVFGYGLPLARIAAICRERGVPLVVDAAQSAGVLPVSLKGLGAAFIAMPGHKSLFGPQGTGMLLCGATPRPLLEGGTGSLSEALAMPDFLPDALEAGTHNVPGICGLAAGLAFIQKTGVAAIADHERRLLRRMAEGLAEIPEVRVYFGTDQCGALSFSLRRMDCEMAARHLARRDIAVRAGLHCAPLAHESAGTLESGTIRASVSALSTEEDVARLVEAVREICSAGNEILDR